MKKERLQQCTIYVDGMHCASCEVLIEKKLIKQENIEAVDASVKDGKVNVVFKGNEKPSLNQLNQDLGSLGYKFSFTKFKRSAERPLFQVTNGSFEINPTKAKKWLNAFIILFIMIAGFFLFEKAQLARYVNVDQNSSVVAFLLLGLVAGTSTCAALVGGVLLSMSKQWNELNIDSDSQLKRSEPHILFHIGRLISFALFGALLGGIGDLISLDNSTVYAILIIAISGVMLLLALQMLEYEPAMKIQLTLPKSITRFAANEQNFTGRFMPFSIGVLTFVLPCGFTLIAQSIALASGNPVRGGLIMLAFALGTLPILLGISLTGVKLNSSPRLTARFNHIAGLLILFFVIYNVNAQLNVLGLKSLSDIRFPSSSSKQSDSLTEVVDEEGVQILQVVADGFSYTPKSSTTLKAGEPTILEVDNQGIQGCGQYMAARGLFKGYVELKPGINKVSFTPEKGTYKLTCSMGMVPPVTIEVI